MTDFEDARRKMVESQLRTENVTDRGLLAAMGAVPREVFVPARLRSLAYIDRDLTLKEAGETGPERLLMEPAPFARLAQLATLSDDDFVLDIGCASGYSAAVLARLSDSVVALESDGELAAQASGHSDRSGGRQRGGGGWRIGGRISGRGTVRRHCPGRLRRICAGLACRPVERRWQAGCGYRARTIRPSHDPHQVGWSNEFADGL